MTRLEAPFFFLALALVGSSARADDECGRPDLLDTYPSNGAVSVPMNATLTAHYAATAEYSGETVVLSLDGGSDQPVAVTFDDTQGLLNATPAGFLAPGSHHVAWPALRGIGTTSLGSSETVGFQVGSSNDTSAPTFDGLAGVAWDVDREHDSCTDSVEDRFVFDLTPGTATDDSGVDNLALVVFQTKGPGTQGSDAAIPVLIAPFPAAGHTTRVVRSIGDGTGHVCFAALVRDLVGQASGGADREVCADTTPPPFFYGCALSTSRDRSPRHRAVDPWTATGAILALAFLGRRRHRRAS